MYLSTHNDDSARLRKIAGSRVSDEIARYPAARLLLGRRNLSSARSLYRSRTRATTGKDKRPAETFIYRLGAGKAAASSLSRARDATRRQKSVGFRGRPIYVDKMKQPRATRRE